ncbi:MAG: zinc transporter [Anaerofustis stercorihominis]|nr:zinc transporter [Anaerofustis stercorihominis]
MKVFFHEGHHDSDGNHDHKHVHTHTHDGLTHTHEHAHEHSHDGEEHVHEELNLHDSSKEMKTLNALIGHWILHGEEHSVSYKEWADKAKTHGYEDAADAINEAVELLEKANEAFRKAISFMR